MALVDAGISNYSICIVTSFWNASSQRGFAEANSGALQEI